MITIGSDVEVFARSLEGKPVALCGLIGGTKHEPQQLAHLPKGFMVQEDNVSLEYNIPPAQLAKEFVQNISIMRNEVTSILSKLNLVVSKESAISFPDDQLTHPQALVFGCEPDYNAWTKTENRRPDTDDHNLRTAGGHIHVGVTNVDMILGIRAMDLFLGVPSVILDNSPSSVLRRQLYGKAGAMRPKPYGFEYRVLSNFWMFDPTLTQWVFDNTLRAMKWAYRGNETSLPYAASVEIQECINTGNVALAKEIIAKYNVKLPGEVDPIETRRSQKMYDFTLDMEALNKVLTNGPNVHWTPEPGMGLHPGNTIEGGLENQPQQPAPTAQQEEEEED